MTDRRYVKRAIKIWIALGAVAIVLGYGSFRAKDFVRGPAIEVISPLTASSFSDSLVEISGTARNLSFLTLDGNKIYTDESGAWKERILLSPGYNVVQIRAEDRFGRTAVEELELIYRKNGI
ncbi:MAG: hypothetical protein Q8L64_06285 [bacterium]|nr:hypothetical protein [bacterium]